MTERDGRRSEREARHDVASHPERPDRHEDDVLRHLSAESYAQTRRREAPTTAPAEPSPPSRVTVAVDGSDGSVAAVDHAAYEATLRGCELRLIHVQPDTGDAAGTSGDRGTALLTSLADRARMRTSTPVSIELATGSVVDILAERAAGPGLLVLGSRGMGPLKQITAGSVSARVLAAAESPVVVVSPSSAPPHVDRQRPIVVGVDGSAESAVAAQFAVDEARLRGVALTAVHATTAFTPPPDPLNVGALDPAQDAGVSVERLAIRDRPAETLIDASTNASAVVVGTRGGGIRGVRLGSTSQALLRRARCPVFVVPPTATHR